MLKGIASVARIIEETSEKNKALNLAQLKMDMTRALDDFLEVCTSTSDFRNVIFKILDAMQVVSNGLFACFTSSYGYYQRGNINKEVEEQHKIKWEQRSEMLENGPLRNEGQVIHKFFYIDGQPLGLFSIELDKNSNQDSILVMIQKLADNAGTTYRRLSSKTIISVEPEKMINTLYDALRELRPDEFQLTLNAIEILEKMSTLMQLSSDQRKIILQASKVIPFGVAFLEKTIPNTNELGLVKEYIRFLDGSTNHLDLETSLLALVYSVLRGGSDKVTSLQPEILALFTKHFPEYEKNLSNAQKIERQLTVTPSPNDSISDIKSIIMGLNLTGREKEILHLVLEGLNNIEVGDYLKISVHTVKNHITNIYRKLNVTDRVQAMAKIYRIKYEQE